MKNHLVIALVLCIISVGCTVHGPVKAKSCTSVVTPPTCTGPKTNPVVTVNTNAMTFAPPNVCAQIGTTIEFKLEPPVNNEKGNAAVVPKVATNTWLLGGNTTHKDKIFVEIPDWVAAGSYEYGFIRSNGDCIDPRVDVTH